SVFLVAGVVGKDLQLRPEELLRPVTLFARLGGWAQVMNRSWNGPGISLKGSRKNLARAGELGLHVPGRAGADVAIHTGNAGVRRQLIRRVLGRHYGVTQLSAELDRVGELVRFVAADDAESDESNDEREDEGKSAALSWIVEVEMQISTLAVRLLPAFPVVIPGAEEDEYQPGNHETGHDHVSQDADVGTGVIGREIDEEQEQEVAECDQRQREPDQRNRVPRPLTKSGQTGRRYGIRICIVIAHATPPVLLEFGDCSPFSASECITHICT